MEQTVRFLPHRGFRGVWRLQHAEFSGAPAFAKEKTGSQAQRAGVRYEQAAQELLERRYSPELKGPIYVRSPWFRFVDDGRMRWIQPDGLLINFLKSRITILEIKIKHTWAAYFSLRRLYEPVIRRVFGSAWKYAVCEVVRWYDGTLPWPEQQIMTDDPASLLANDFGVHILRAR